MKHVVGLEFRLHHSCFVHVTILFGSAILQMMVDCIEDEPAVTVLLGRTRVPDSGRLVHEEKIPLELI